MTRILLVAPTCDGHDVGEAWVAYQWADLLGRRHDVTLLTYHKRDRVPARDQLRHVRVVEWIEPRGLGRFERLNSMLKPAYAPFYFRAKQWIRSAIANGEKFDVGFQPVPVAMRYGSPLTASGLPYVIGPVGGGLADPPGFDKSTETAPWFVRLRSLDGFRLRWDPSLRNTYQDAACVLGIAPYVRESLKDMRIRRFEIMSETGLISLPDARERTLHEAPLRLLFVGRIIRTKGTRYIIEALSALRGKSVTLDIIGDGPDRKHCEGLVNRLGLRDKVTFHGRLAHDLVDAFYRKADVFVFPSYREPGGAVTFEAMGHGLPLIVCNRGGPGVAADDRCAFRLEVSTEANLVSDIASSVETLLGNHALAVDMGKHARVRAESTAMWSHRVDQFDELLSTLDIDRSRERELP